MFRSLAMFLRWKNAVFVTLEIWFSKDKLLSNITPRCLTVEVETVHPSSCKLWSKRFCVLLSPCFLFPGGFYPVPPCQLLKWDTGVYHLHLTYLSSAPLLSLFPAADLAEPRPLRHKDILSSLCSWIRASLNGPPPIFPLYCLHCYLIVMSAQKGF